MRADLVDTADDERYCQQCGQPCHFTETLCEDCRYPDLDPGDQQPSGVGARDGEQVRPGFWAQGEGAHFPEARSAAHACNLYRAAMARAEVAVNAGASVDGLEVPALRRRVADLEGRLARQSDELRRARRECAMNRHLVNVVIRVSDLIRRRRYGPHSLAERAIVANVSAWAAEYDEVIDDECRAALVRAGVKE